MRRLDILILLPIFIVLIFNGCAHYPDNPPISSLSPATGYRYGVVRQLPTEDKPFVILTFSGGGTRAAAFSFGVMEGLKDIEYTAKDGSKHRLLNDVEIISSVSGGSFTSAYYALFPDRFFSDFPKDVLYRNIEGDLKLQLLNPYNWFRLASSDFSRTDMADEYYNRKIFKEQTFADLLKKPKGSVPFLIINATDMSTLHRFVFTQDQFDFLCSDLSGVSISRAVTASSCFPVAFAPLTMNIYKNGCGRLPEALMLALNTGKSPKERVAEARAAKSYFDPDRQFAHLLDGGLTDNLGLRVAIDMVMTTDLARLERVIILAVNAKTTRTRTWDAKSDPPGIISVLSMVTDGPMDTVTSDSINLIQGKLNSMKQLELTVDSCFKVLDKYCPKAPSINNPHKTDFTLVELSLDGVYNPRLNRCLQEIPTSLNLPATSVELLKVVGRYLLFDSQPFVSALKRLDPSWQPEHVDLDERMIDKACGPVATPTNASPIKMLPGEIGEEP